MIIGNNKTTKKSYNERKTMIKEYESTGSWLKKELKYSVKYYTQSMNPARLYYHIKNSKDTNVAVSNKYGLSIKIVEEIRNTKAK
ncbi:MAG: hypothetical protein COA44_12985 [Arcobacter sp.]|nr:MAG: hypothetical protein COA44_12985 [Arcobacter sp.]